MGRRSRWELPFPRFVPSSHIAVKANQSGKSDKNDKWASLFTFEKVSFGPRQEIGAKAIFAAPRLQSPEKLLSCSLYGPTLYDRAK